MPLPNDISRCVGKRIEEDASVTVCIKRNACERYMSLHEEGLSHVPVTTPCSFHLCTDASYSMQIERVSHGSHPQHESVDTPGR